MTERKVVAIEDAITATERALDDALWNGEDPTLLELRLASLRVAQSVGEKWETSW